MSEEMQWQPARCFPAHGFTTTTEEAETMKKSIIFVRPTVIQAQILSGFRAKGCDGTQFYELREDPLKSKHRIVVCEHEILTD